MKERLIGIVIVLVVLGVLAFLSGAFDTGSAAVNTTRPASTMSDSDFKDLRIP